MTKADENPYGSHQQEVEDKISYLKELDPHAGLEGRAYALEVRLKSHGEQMTISLHLSARATEPRTRPFHKRVGIHCTPETLGAYLGAIVGVGVNQELLDAADVAPLMAQAINPPKIVVVSAQAPAQQESPPAKNTTPAAQPLPVVEPPAPLPVAEPSPKPEVTDVAAAAPMKAATAPAPLPITLPMTDPLETLKAKVATLGNPCRISGISIQPLYATSPDAYVKISYTAKGNSDSEMFYIQGMMEPGIRKGDPYQPKPSMVAEIASAITRATGHPAADLRSMMQPSGQGSDFGSMRF